MSETSRPPKPYHRWPSNENIDKHPTNDRCLACGVWRYPQLRARKDQVEEQEAIATGPCPGGRCPVHHLPRTADTWTKACTCPSTAHGIEEAD